jgi:hypothetical protein
VVTGGEMRPPRIKPSAERRLQTQEEERNAERRDGKFRFSLSSKDMDG